MNFTQLAEISCLLVDNGSLNPAATRSLRRIAKKLEASIAHPVHPISLLHSDRVPSGDLGGIPADTLETFIREAITTGKRRFVVLPFFFGPSAALTQYIPQRITALAKSTPGLEVSIADSLVRTSDPEDNRIARILAENVRSTAQNAGVVSPAAVVLVDHGSPQPAVTAVRNHARGQMAAELRDFAQVVLAASMERRQGPEYDFNEPLLERALRRSPCGPGAGDVIVSMMFLSPGRHAGSGGDVEQICKSAEEASPGLKTHLTPLVGDHPLLVEILADRFRETIRQ